eukprot:c41915_g1_i1 orf=237-449(+)
MVLLGCARQHSAEFYFSWQLIRAVTTEILWTARNKYLFQQQKIDVSLQLHNECFAKIGRCLLNWPGKDKE